MPYKYHYNESLIKTKVSFFQTHCCHWKIAQKMAQRILHFCDLNAVLHQFRFLLQFLIYKGLWKELTDNIITTENVN